MKPRKIHTVVLSTQHADRVGFLRRRPHVRCLVGTFVDAWSKSVARQRAHGDAVSALAVVVFSLRMSASNLMVALIVFAFVLVARKCSGRRHTSFSLDQATDRSFRYNKSMMSTKFRSLHTSVSTFAKRSLLWKIEVITYKRLTSTTSQSSSTQFVTTIMQVPETSAGSAEAHVRERWSQMEQTSIGQSWSLDVLL